MTDESLTQHQQHERSNEFRSYTVGYVLALVLTLIPFSLVAWSDFSKATLWTTIGGCALVQIIVHFRCFLHVSFSRQKREDLHLILFTVLILAIMVGGTLWIMYSLYMRMIPSMIPW
ncbi:cytochrome o ubiquinol oxidase subunit IV [Chromohalobacter israelensis]|uniref:cytochrome o ubiquinol oxidase subunit IV n=1 Tax=Chromohalobacter israelensis TaxID=141390 RepID=UPI0015C496C7|nr:cytochrome o ubiquinol oxidase subunit IV [Chromohalobacter salexigens]MDO0946890.1 cytochrome o ubiquinol oxidase subunit IV [Chromohalobacter salexigens]NWO57274.1 cytochrome o ubiquinol oxidase subunit IV [Chromohalobacter salexigens]